MPPIIPPLLEDYITPAPPGSLTLITSVLEAPCNWLVLRFVHAAVAATAAAGAGAAASAPTSQRGGGNGNQTDAAVGNDGGGSGGGGGGDGGGGGGGRSSRAERRVIFVSFLRGFELWREMGKKMGLDLPALLASKRLVYIDGLSPLPSTSSSSSSSSPGAPPSPALASPPPGRTGNPPPMIPLNPANVHTLAALIAQQSASPDAPPDGAKPIVIVDAIDVTLALGAQQPHHSSPAARTLASLVLGLREISHSTTLACSADLALLHPSASGPATPLETAHRAFVVTLAHQARFVLQLRGLGTGAARDVSGVLRVSKGGGGGGGEGEEMTEDEDEDDAGGEWLYLAKGDGSVSVWGKGE